MKAFVTGGTGFVGARLVERLRTRGDDVVALVRAPARAPALAHLGCELVAGDVADPEAVRRAVTGCDAVFHVAGVYRVGIGRRERPAMCRANVVGTETVLDAAAGSGASRIVYVSTCNVFGNTRGRIVDESYRRPLEDGFLSYYDETKYLAHRIAEQRAESGVPVVIAMPGAVYGPGDHSEVGWMLGRLRAGRLRVRMLFEVGLNLVHIDDVAEGMLLVHDRGDAGESYVLGGEIATMGDLIDRAAAILGRRPPRLTIPPWMLRLGIPMGPVLARVLGTPPNLAEAIRSGDGVTYWGTDGKARRELGYAPRSLEQGLRETLSRSPPSRA